MNGRTADIGAIIDNGKLSRFQVVVLIMCFLVVLVDGFDTAVIGYIAPALRKEWGLTAAQLSPAFGAGLFGLMCGSFVLGPVADTIGRRKVLLLSVLVFSLGTFASADAQSIGMLTVLRFVTGIGLGGAMPTCITLSSEYSPARHRMLMVTLSFSGFTTGLALGGELASHVIPAFGWRGLLVVGGAMPLMLLPVLSFLLPESVRFMAAHPTRKAALAATVERMTGTRGWDKVTFVEPQRTLDGRSPARQLFTEGRAARTVLLWGSFFCSLFVFYLLTSWLPSILKDAGYDMASAARIGAMVPLGGTLGAIVVALLMDRMNVYRILAVTYFGAAVAIAMTGFLLGDVLALSCAVFLVGFGTAGAQNGLNLTSASIYPTSARATGVSWAMANGRIGSIMGSMAGAPLMAHFGQGEILFTAIAVPALLGAIAILLLGWLTGRAHSAGSRDVAVLS
jgi:AAHS family 4-hydroxybenzoate transporter-like MFS transporter